VGGSEVGTEPPGEERLHPVLGLIAQTRKTLSGEVWHLLLAVNAFAQPPSYKTGLFEP
jgi:hypothetical protein